MPKPRSFRPHHHGASRTITIIWYFLERGFFVVQLTINSVIISCSNASRSCSGCPYFTPTVDFTVTLGSNNDIPIKHLFSFSFTLTCAPIFFLRKVTQENFKCKLNLSTVYACLNIPSLQQFNSHHNLNPTKSFK